MKRIRKILVPVDFSPGSAAAWETARMLVNTMHGYVSVELLHVWEGEEQKLPDLTLRADRRGSAARLLSEARAHGLSLEHAAEFMAQLEKDGIEIVARMRRGAVVETIVRTAVEGDFDLIVIGTEGRGKTSLRGATAERVAHLSPIPVLTAPLASQQQHEERTRVA